MKKDRKWFDIICGTLVFIALVLVANKAWGYDENGGRYCLAQNIYFEAGNQPFSGKVAVANVTMNRVDDLQFPNEICDVVYQTKEWRTSWTGEQIPVRGQCQFSWFCDGKSDSPKVGASQAFNLCYMLAELRLNNSDMSILPNDVYWYHNDSVRPYWASAYSPYATIGDHLFYSD